MKIDRLISIIMILLERQKVSLTELSEMFEVTPRTIQRDLDAINQAGIPIVSSPGVGGGIGIMENYKLEKRLFSTADVTTLLMGLGSIRTSLTGSEVVTALAKVKGMIPEEQRAEIELRARQITIDTTPWAGMRNYNDEISAIQAAMDSQRLLRFSYTDRMMNKMNRTVEPYRLVLKGTRWYLDGYCLEREDYRLFKLSRMNNLEILDTFFELRPYSPSQQIKPVFQDEGVQLATLRVKEAAIDRLSEIMDTSGLQAEGDGTWIVHIPIQNDTGGYKFLLSLGADVECLAPLELRQGLQQYLTQIVELYV